MKTYVLTVSKTFPVTHKRKGEPTYFAGKIIKALIPLNIKICEEFGHDLIPKIHTIRSNYQLWKKRINELMTMNTWPNGWDGTEKNGSILLDSKYSDGSTMSILFDELRAV